MADGKRKILYVINHIDWFWSHRLPLALGAREARLAVHVAVPGAAQDGRFAQHGLTAHDLPAADNTSAPAAALRMILSIAALLRREQPETLHAITIKTVFFTGLAALLAGYKGRKVYTIAGLGYLFSGEGLNPRLLRFSVGPFLRLVLRSKNTRLIFQNPDDMALMISRDFAAAEYSHLILGSGVDTNIFKPADEASASQAEPVVLMPTRLVHDKGVAIFAAAARILRQRGVRVRMQIAGGVSKNNPLAISEQEMHEMTRGGALEWLGHVADMPALLAGAALVAYPSYYREGIPKVLLEAAAMGKPIITTDHPGCREVVRDGQNGLLVPVKDAGALADAVQTLLGNAKMRRAMGDESRKLALQHFDVRSIVAQTLKVYE